MTIFSFIQILFGSLNNCLSIRFLVSSLFLFYYFKHTYFIVFQNVHLWEALGMLFILLFVSENLLMISFSLYCLPFHWWFLYQWESCTDCLSCRDDLKKRGFILVLPGPYWRHQQLGIYFNLFVNFLTWDCYTMRVVEVYL